MDQNSRLSENMAELRFTFNQTSDLIENSGVNVEKQYDSASDISRLLRILEQTRLNAGSRDETVTY